MGLPSDRGKVLLLSRVRSKAHGLTFRPEQSSRADDHARRCEFRRAPPSDEGSTTCNVQHVTSQIWRSCDVTVSRHDRSVTHYLQPRA